MLLFDSDNLLKFTKMVKCLPEFEYFTVFLKNKNFISKIRRSKVTDYAALRFGNSNVSIAIRHNKHSGTVRMRIHYVRRLHALPNCIMKKDDCDQESPRRGLN